MAGGNSFIRGTVDKFGNQFGVPKTRHEQNILRSFCHPTPLAKEKRESKHRKQYTHPTKVKIGKQEPRQISTTKLIQAKNKLIGLIGTDKLPRHVIMDLGFCVSWIDQYLEALKDG